MQQADRKTQCSRNPSVQTATGSRSVADTGMYLRSDSLIYSRLLGLAWGQQQIDGPAVTDAGLEAELGTEGTLTRVVDPRIRGN